MSLKLHHTWTRHTDTYTFAFHNRIIVVPQAPTTATTAVKVKSV